MICFKCLKELTPAFGDLEDEAKTPSRGLIFSASGNYGSRVYDPTMSAPQLVIWICDECVIRNYNLVKMRSYAFIQTETTWNDFDPERSYQ